MKKTHWLLTMGLLSTTILIAQVPLTSDNIGAYAQPLENQRLSTSSSPTFTGITTTGYNTGNIMRILSSSTDLWDISTGSNILSFYGYNGTSFATSLQLNRNGNASFAGTVSASEMGSNGFNFNNVYTNRIEYFTASANFRSGSTYRTTGSINWGLEGYDASGFQFRWLSNNNAPIDYSSDANLLMYLTKQGDLHVTGEVSIGSTAAQKPLIVNGNIKTRKITVTQTGWADYVFDSSYQLKPLHQVEKYIQQNKHLPEVPSAATVSKEGIDLGDNQALLLKKIEELTLYIISQEKRIKQLEEKVK